jgi:hypothetical protein
MAATRNTSLTDILFPVELRHIYFPINDSTTENGMLEGLGERRSKRYHRVPHFQAVVDVERNNVFSVVTEGYRLVLNEEAIKLGRECFKSVFSHVTVKGMEVFNIISPKTRSFCHVDYIHKDSSFEPWKGDKWVPFLRVTNSYNRMKPLGFDVGFCRWICTNGLVFGEKSIRFRYVHTKGDVGRSTQFQTTFGELKTLEKQFIESLHNLQRFYVPKAVMLPILLRAFKVRVRSDDLAKPKRREQLLALRKTASSLTEQYFNDIGPNGYAALNVLTDFATRPEAYISPETMVNQLQKRSGDWMEDFVREVKQDSFDFNAYLGEYREFAKVLNESHRL